MLLYLDTSAIVKRYVKESGSDLISEIYEKAWRANMWNNLALRLFRLFI